MQNFQNPKRNFVEEYVGSLYTKNQANWAIFEEFFRLSVENVVPKSQRENLKKLTFFGEKSANFQNFSEIFWNLIKHIQIYIWSKF